MTVFNHVNRCIWTAISAGLGDFVVSAAAQYGYTPALCLNPTVVNGANYHYFAFNPADQTQHEEGDGVYTVLTTTLTRGTIRNSSNLSSGGALLLSDGASFLLLTNGVSHLLLAQVGGPQKVNFTAPPIVVMGGPVATDLP